MGGRLDDLTALWFFLIAAERENLMLNGRKATDVVEAAARLIGYDAEALAAVRRAIK